MSSSRPILDAVGKEADAYCIVCKKRVFATENDKRAQKRTNFPKICSFNIDSYYRMLYPTILTMSDGI